LHVVVASIASEEILADRPMTQLGSVLVAIANIGPQGAHRDANLARGIDRGTEECFAGHARIVAEDYDDPRAI
jgi:hypothetical protein